MRSYSCYELDTNSAYIELFNITKMQYESIMKFLKDNNIECQNIPCTTSTVCANTEEVVNKNTLEKTILEEKTKEINLNLLQNDSNDENETMEIKKSDMEIEDTNIQAKKVVKGFVYGIPTPRKPVIFGKK